MEPAWIFREQGGRDELNSQPLVSVVTIFWNAERFLQEAIDSVFAQTCYAWELLLVDDGSTDGSTAMARNYSERYPNRVRYLEHAGHQNRGMSAARDLGARQAKGQYIAYLDADDVWLPSKLEQQVAVLKAYPEAAMVYGTTQWWYGWTGRSEDARLDFVQPLGAPTDALIQPPVLLSAFFFRQQYALPSMSNAMFRRKSIEDIGGYGDDFQMNLYEDQAFIAKICLRAPVIATKTCWDRYRQHPESSCAVAGKEGRIKEYEARVYFLNWLAAYLSAQGVKDPKIWQGLRKESWRCRHPNLSRVVGQGKRLRRW